MQHSAKYSEKSKNYAVILCNFHTWDGGSIRQCQTCSEIPLSINCKYLVLTIFQIKTKFNHDNNASHRHVWSNSERVYFIFIYH